MVERATHASERATHASPLPLFPDVMTDFV